MNKKLKWRLLLVASIIYLLNPTLGVWEIIPDQIPLIGNLDEAGAVLLAIKAWKELSKK